MKGPKKKSYFLGGEDSSQPKCVNQNLQDDMFGVGSSFSEPAFWESPMLSHSLDWANYAFLIS